MYRAASFFAFLGGGVIHTSDVYAIIDVEQIGRRAKDYAEVALRTTPTLSDVELALVDVGKLYTHTCTCIHTYNCT